MNSEIIQKTNLKSKIEIGTYVFEDLEYEADLFDAKSSINGYWSYSQYKEELYQSVNHYSVDEYNPLKSILDADNPPLENMGLDRKKLLDKYGITKDGYARFVIEHHLSADKRRYRIKIKDRKSHTYIYGGTESGKSELIKSLVYQHLVYEPDATNIIIDPEGELADEIARFACLSEDDVLFVNSSDTMNILDSGGNPQAVIKVLSELLGKDEQLTSRMKRCCIIALRF